MDNITLFLRRFTHYSPAISFSSKLLNCRKTGNLLKQTSIVPKSHSAMNARSNSKEASYQDAIHLLNSLQSNAQIRMAIKNTTGSKNTSLQETEETLLKIGVSLDDLDNLRFIHVTGSKGKGSTCASTESILRHAGLTTGFYSSPHLLTVRERIRLNGESLSESKFTRYFFDTFNRILKWNAEHETNKMPPYFQFLTCMAFRVFLEEKVDVAVMEVGIGGKYDNTNVIRKPVVVGISYICLEHQDLLGTDVKSIAEHKAGIMKKGSPAFTLKVNDAQTIQVLKETAAAVGCSLHFPTAADKLKDIYEGLSLYNIKAMKQNAGLAIQLAVTFLQSYSAETGKDLLSSQHSIESLVRSGLENTKWPGRFQIVDISNNVTLYLDGAHTVESLEIARDWFRSQTFRLKESTRILSFYLTHGRSLSEMLKVMAKDELFEDIILCSLQTSGSTLDTWDSNGPCDQLEPCRKILTEWRQLKESHSSKGLILLNSECVIDHLLKLGTVYPNKRYDVLVTGSLYLVSAYLSSLKYNIK